VFWLEQEGIEPKDDVVERIFDAAKRSDRLLENEEILALAAGGTSSSGRGRQRSPSGS